MSKIKILVAGGCHVEGWLVGQQNSFVSALSSNLEGSGISNEILIEPYALLTRSDKLLKSIKSTNPDILILQFGNYEFSPSLPAEIRKRVMKKVGKKNTNKTIMEEGGREEGAKKDPKETFDITLKFKVSQLVKLFANLLVLNSWLDKKYWSQVTLNYFEEIKKIGVKYVYVLSPFPTSNKITNIYRSQGGQILELSSKQYGFAYVDVFNVLKDTYPNQTITIDEMHLNYFGHKTVGSVLADKIINDLK